MIFFFKNNNFCGVDYQEITIAKKFADGNYFDFLEFWSGKSQSNCDD